MSQKVTHTERIQELSDISNDVVAMLTAAGEAINTLTGRSTSSTHDDENDARMADDATEPLENQRQAFDSKVTAYYKNLQSVCARLRRQVYALEEASIISSESVAFRSGGRSSATNEQNRITNGGLGNLDVGWLNSRSNRVGAEKEHEIATETIELLRDQLDKDGRRA